MNRLEKRMANYYKKTYGYEDPFKQGILSRKGIDDKNVNKRISNFMARFDSGFESIAQLKEFIKEWEIFSKAYPHYKVNKRYVALDNKINEVKDGL